MKTNFEIRFPQETRIPDGSFKEARGGKAEGSSASWKSVVIGGIGGILIGAGSVRAAMADDETDNGELLNGNSAQVPEGAASDAAANVSGRVADNPASIRVLSGPEGVKVAEMNDDLSFGDAFSSARATVGADGAFTWRGGVYSTHTKEEWDVMSKSEKIALVRNTAPEYGAGKVNTSSDADDDLLADNNSAAQVEENQEAEANDVAAATETVESSTTTSDGDPAVVENETVTNQDETSSSSAQSSAGDADPDVQIIGEGIVQLPDGTIVNAARLQVNDADVVVVDVDQNGTPDVMFVDVDGDGQADIVAADTEGNGNMEVVAVREDLQQADTAEQQKAENNPDVIEASGSQAPQTSAAEQTEDVVVVSDTQVAQAAESNAEDVIVVEELPDSSIPEVSEQEMLDLRTASLEAGEYADLPDYMNNADLSSL